MFARSLTNWLWLAMESEKKCFVEWNRDLLSATPIGPGLCQCRSPTWVIMVICGFSRALLSTCTHAIRQSSEAINFLWIARETLTIFDVFVNEWKFKKKTLHLRRLAHLRPERVRVLRPRPTQWHIDIAQQQSRELAPDRLSVNVSIWSDFYGPIVG